MGGSHDLFVGDAGQELWEEVSITVKGGNYGWNVKEGTHCFSTENPDESPADCPDSVDAPHPRAGDPLIDPVIEYANHHQPGGLGATVIGGHVYRGQALPQLSGRYVFPFHATRRCRAFRAARGRARGARGRAAAVLGGPTRPAILRSSRRTEPGLGQAARSSMRAVVFTVEQRDALRGRVLALADKDRRVVAGAAVGSLAVGGGDRFSDLDLTFAVADDVPVADVLDDWTRTLTDELGAVQLVDLERGPTIYRVFLLPDALQFDLSLTPAARFAAAGPRFRLLFGETAAEAGTAPKPPAAGELFGWGVIYCLHARACVERGRVWQAEHYIGAVRDHALSLGCLRRELPAVQARGYDDLPADTLASFDGTHVGSLEPERLRSALSAATRALLHEGKQANVPSADAAAQPLAESRYTSSGD